MNAIVAQYAVCGPQLQVVDACSANDTPQPAKAEPALIAPAKPVVKTGERCVTERARLAEVLAKHAKSSDPDDGAQSVERDAAGFRPAALKARWSCAA